jgi:hypothetical protein
VILLPRIELKQAVTIAEGLCEACEARALVQQDWAAKFTISVGVGTQASGTSDLGGLLRQADAALYRAKKAGGNQVASGRGQSVQHHSASNSERRPTRSGLQPVPWLREAPQAVSAGRVASDARFNCNLIVAKTTAIPAVECTRLDIELRSP